MLTYLKKNFFPLIEEESTQAQNLSHTYTSLWLLGTSTRYLSNIYNPTANYNLEII